MLLEYIDQLGKCNGRLARPLEPTYRTVVRVCLNASALNPYHP